MPSATKGDHYQNLFECAPISMLMEDFSGIKLFFDDLRASGVIDLQQYLDDHPEEIKNSTRRMKVNHVNREALNLFGASSEQEFLVHLEDIFRGEMLALIRSQLTALWNGEENWSGEGISYRLGGETIHLRLRWRILPESTSGWECVPVSIENMTALKQAEKRYNDLFENAPISLWEQDYSALKKEFDGLRAQGITELRTYLDSHPEAVDRFMGLIRILNVNQRTLELFDADDKEMLFANLKKVFRQEMMDVFINTLVDMWDGKAYYEHEAVNYSLSGEPVNVHWHWTLMPSIEHDCSWVLVALQDITKRKRAEEYLRYVGTHDLMTTLYNRAFFEETLQNLEVDRTDPISFIVVDLNDLKNANDSFGHNTGDRLIRRAAEVLKASIDSSYMAARIGGDEFIIIMPGADEETAHALVKRMHTLVTVNNKYHPGPALSFALGAATSAPGLSLEKVISLADNAMYQDKGKYHQRREDDKSSMP